MSDKKINISDLVKAFEMENNIVDDAKDETTVSDITDTEDIKDNISNIFESNQDSEECCNSLNNTYPDTDMSQQDYNNANQQQSVSVSAFNLFSGNSSCIGKYVKFANDMNVYLIAMDNNYTPVLCVLNQQSQQYEPIMNITILFENSQFVLYQNNLRCGILYGNANEPCWQYIPDGMAVPTSNTNVTASTPAERNNLKRNIILNNVPADKAESTFEFIGRLNPTDNVYVNFADSKSDNSSDEDNPSNFIDITSD